MSVNDPKRLPDGYTACDGGMDSGLPPSLIQPNQVAWAVNTTFRGGWPRPRPGIVKRELNFGGCEPIRAGLEDGYFQGAGTYKTDAGQAYLALSVSGRIFTIEVTGAYAVKEITIAGDPNQVTEPHAWFQQAETWLVVQNNLNAPLLYNGSGSRRAGPDEVPVGGPMAYGNGRLWVARASQYFGGDLVWSQEAYGRDSVIRFTENTFLNEGGAFAVSDGPVTGMAFAANLDSSLGDSELTVATLTNVYSFNAPIDRDVWKDLQQPLQRIAARKFGSVNHESMTLVNGDIIYRSPDGIRSLQYSRRDFDMWGQTPISRQAHRALQYDTQERLTEASGVNFDNRMLMTIQPQMEADHGIWHRGLAVLDYHRVTGMGERIPPVWEGVWTGLRILRIISIDVGSTTRCFIFALSTGNQIQLYEVTKSAAFDFAGVDDVPIAWTIESRAWTFRQPVGWKRLTTAAQWLDLILGSVSIQAYFRCDESECWHRWDLWQDCVKYRNCEASELCASYPYGAVIPIEPLRGQVRPYMGMSQPPDYPDPQTGGLARDGYEMQVRYEMTGHFRLKRFMIVAHEMQEPLFGDLRKTTCPPEIEAPPCDDSACPSLSCCDRDDYGYRINNEDYPGYPCPPDQYPGVQGYPYPSYPGYPVIGGGIGGDNEELPPPAENDPPWEPEDPSGPPESCGSEETTIYITSNYVWALNEGQDPNVYLSPEQIACHLVLHAIEVSDAVAAYESLGNTVTVGLRKWVYDGSVGNFLAMIRKPTCNPNDGIGDHYVLFGGSTTIQTVLCVVPPA